MPEQDVFGAPSYKYLEPGGIEKTTQEAIDNKVSGFTEAPRGMASMPRGTLVILALAGLWLFWPKIKKAL